LVQGHYQEAYARFRDGLKVASDFGDKTLLAHCLEGLSGLASALGQHQRAVRLGGAAAALREAAGALQSPAWGHIAERWLAISRKALGEDAASAAWAAGRSLPMERALEEAEDPTVGSYDKPHFLKSLPVAGSGRCAIPPSSTIKNARSPDL